MLQYEGKHNRKGLDMKHKITVIISIVIIVSVAVLAVVHYEHYRQWRDTQAVKARISAKVQAEWAMAQAAANQKKLDGLKAQCNKDHAAYTALTAAQRVKTTLTDCDPSLELAQ